MGALHDWWKPKARAGSKRARRCDRSFNRAASWRACVNGELTLGENIGDLGGLSIA